MALDLSALDKEWLGAGRFGAGTAPRAPLSEFEEDPDNPRFEDAPAEFAALVADVRERGILQPIIVRRLDSGRLRIRFGMRRYRAAVEIGLKDVPFIVTEDARQFDDYAQVAENERRTKLQPLEMATFIVKKLGAGETRRAIARRMGIDPGSVTHYLALTGDAPAFLMELYHSRRCRSPKHLYRLRLLWDVDPLQVERACADATEVDGGFIDHLMHAQALRSEDPSRQGSQRRKPTGLPSSETPIGIDQRPDMHADPKSPIAASNVDAGGEGRRKRRAAASRDESPQLYGSVDGREVLLRLSRQPSSEEKVFVQYLDGDVACEEIALSRVALTRLLRSGR